MKPPNEPIPPARRADKFLGNLSAIFAITFMILLIEKSCIKEASGQNSSYPDTKTWWYPPREFQESAMTARAKEGETPWIGIFNRRAARGGASNFWKPEDVDIVTIKEPVVVHTNKAWIITFPH